MAGNVMERLPNPLRRHLAAVRAVAVLTVILGVLYPLLVTGVAQVLLSHRAGGSILRADGRDVGSALIGQSFTGEDGAPIRKYFQSRPSAGGYDPLASGASNLGPQDVADRLPDPRGSARPRGRAESPCSPRCAPAPRRSANGRASAGPGRTAPVTGSARC
ncbi:hypothetical protein GCM10027612_08130 [Microbispora bryophytorum subsp. camponoti]